MSETTLCRVCAEFPLFQNPKKKTLQNTYG